VKNAKPAHNRIVYVRPLEAG